MIKDRSYQTPKVTHRVKSTSYIVIQTLKCMRTCLCHMTIFEEKREIINSDCYTAILKYFKGQASLVGDDESGQGSTNEIIGQIKAQTKNCGRIIYMDDLGTEIDCTTIVVYHHKF